MKQKTKKTLGIVAVGVALVAMAGGMIGLNNKVEKNTTYKYLSISDYGIYALDDTTGKKTESTEIITSDFFNIQGSTVKIHRDFDGVVYGNLYDRNKNFLAVVELNYTTWDKNGDWYIMDSFGSYLPSVASHSSDRDGYCRLEVEPGDDEITSSEKSTYLSNFEVRVNKDWN